MCDVWMIPSLITPLEDVEVPLCSMAAEYAVLESPGYTVPEESGFTWIPGFVPVSEVVLEEGGYLRSLEELLPSPVTTSAVTTAISSMLAEPVLPVVPQTPDDRLGYGKCPQNGMGTGVRCGNDDWKCVRMLRTSGRI